MASIFFEYYFCILIKIAEFCSQGSVDDVASLVLGNGMAPSRWQAVTWTIDNATSFIVNYVVIIVHDDDHVFVPNGGRQSAGTMLAKLDTMMTSSNWNIFRVTGPLWGEFTGHRWIPLTKASDAELWCFLWSAPEQTVEQTIEAPVIWDAIAPIMMSL